MWVLWLPRDDSVLHLARNAGPATYDPLCNQLAVVKVNLRDPGPDGCEGRELPRWFSDQPPGRWVHWTNLSTVPDTEWRMICKRCLANWKRRRDWERATLIEYLHATGQTVNVLHL